jgi:hypothetical protein
VNNNKKDEFNANQQQLAEVGKVLLHHAKIAIIQFLAKVNKIKTGDISITCLLKEPLSQSI